MTDETQVAENIVETELPIVEAAADGKRMSQRTVDDVVNGQFERAMMQMFVKKNGCGTL